GDPCRSVGQPGSAADRDRPIVPGDGAVAADSRVPPADGFDGTDIPRDGTAVLRDRTGVRLQRRADLDREAAEGRPPRRGGSLSARGAVSRHADRRASAQLAHRHAARRQARQDRRDGANCGQGVLAGMCRTITVTAIEITQKRKGADGMIGVRKISHASYETPDLEKQADYYTNILGLTLIAKERDAVYLANTNEHHSVILRQGAQPRCTRIGFQLGPDDDLGAFEKQTAAHGLRTSRKKDAEPTIGDMVVFEDPKGTVMEVFKRPEPQRQGF